MAVTHLPIFVQTPNLGRARLTTGNTTRDLSSLTNASLLFEAGSDGGRVDKIVFTHVAGNSTQASIACVGRIYGCDDAAGTNPRLIAEIDLEAVTPSTTAKGQSQVITQSPAIQLGANESLWCSISVTQTSGGYDVVAYGGNY